MNGLLGAFALNLMNYLIPIAVNFSVDPDREDWRESYFTKILFVKSRFPLWLGILMVVGASMGKLFR